MNGAESDDENGCGDILLSKDELQKLAAEIYRGIIGIAPCNKNCKTMKDTQEKLDKMQIELLKRMQGEASEDNKARIILELSCSSAGAL